MRPNWALSTRFQAKNLRFEAALPADMRELIDELGRFNR